MIKPKTQNYQKNINLANYTMELKKLNSKEEFVDVAYAFTSHYVANKMTLFTSENVKAEFYKIYEPPFEPRWWGTIFRRLSNEKAILKRGYARYTNPLGNGKPATLWISQKYHLKQKLNRQLNGLNQTEIF